MASRKQDLAELRRGIGQQFQAAFGRTPLLERITDILVQAESLSRFTDMDHLRDEAGDLVCSVLQLCNECSWEPAELVAATLGKIARRQEIYNSLGRKLRVALLGGAFDPIHRGHLAVARAALQHGGVDEVWLLPCFEHLAGKSMAAADHRLEMCRLAVRSMRSVGVFDYEIRHRFCGETYHLVKNLLAEPLARLRCDFSLIIGQDNADEISTWNNGEALARLIPFIVAPRPGCDPPNSNAWYLRSPHRYLADASQTEAYSSTEVRRLLRQGDPEADNLLPAGIADYTRQNGLYPAEATSVVAVSPRKTAIFVGTFDPPCAYHRAAVQQLLDSGFDQVVISPTASLVGASRDAHVRPTHCAALADMNFRGLPKTNVDLSELERRQPAAVGHIERRYDQNAEVWLAVDSEHVRGGGAVLKSRLESGDERWHGGRFVVLHAHEAAPAPTDLPPQHRLLPVDNHVSAAVLRNKVFEHQPIDEWTTAEVAAYIDRHRLFRSFVGERSTRLQVSQPRLQIEYDERNPKAAEIVERYSRFRSDTPNLILVVGGDGTMLQAIRRHWRLRLPFLGINAGHLGFLANEDLPSDLDRLELVVHTFPMLRVETRSVDGHATTNLAFGDAWMERDGGQAAWLRLDVDGETRVKKIVGDGMLVATAAGSSAYARALGASPLPLDTHVLTLAGSNIFQPRFWKPVTLTDDTEISLVALDRSGKRPVRGFVDGKPLGLVESMNIARSAVASVELAFTGEFDPSAKLLRTLFPPND